MTEETKYHILNFQTYCKMHAGAIIIEGTTSEITKVRCLKLDYQKRDRSAYGLIITNNNGILEALSVWRVISCCCCPSVVIV